MSEKFETKFLLIGGEWRETKRTFDAPALFSGDLLGKVGTANQSQIGETIAAAHTGRVN